MYINVKLLNGFSRHLTYKIPPSWITTDLIGSIVTVPLQKRTELAFVTDMMPELPAAAQTFNIREIIAQEKIPGDMPYAQFINKLSEHYIVEPLLFYQRLQQFLNQKEHTTEFAEQAKNGTVLPALTAEQTACLAKITPMINEQKYNALLLHGVTGSGKTEIYKHAIMQAQALNKTVLFLVPEVSLAVQFTALFRQALPSCTVFGFHSATSVADKKELWRQLMYQKPIVIVGVHLPLLLPIANLGLIIIDEEHDVGYQEKKHPKINTKEAALLRAHSNQIPVLLGSATPSLQSLHNVANKKWQVTHLTQRFAGAFPKTKVVYLTRGEQRTNFWISRELEHAIKDRLAKKEQIIIFLNRRGYSFFVQCAACGFVCECPSCSVSLTLHEDHSLRCHYCSYKTAQPERCSACKPKKPTFIKKGIGTQQVVTILQAMFPQATIARADLDSTVNKKKWQQTVAQFHDRTLDILVGTQTITKGYHFPGVTLVGVLWADINLNMPFYNAAETTLQQLIQVAGRAGRQAPESLVIVQSMIEHPIFNYLDEQRYTKFYEHEIANRQLVNYPPCSRFAEIELRHTDEKILEHESTTCAKIIADFQQQHGLELTVLGPAQPPVHKIKNIFSRKIYLKSSHYATLQKIYREVLAHELAVQTFFTLNPLQ